MGLSLEELVALVGGGHGLGKAHAETSGFEGTWTSDPLAFGNAYFTNLLDAQLSAALSPGGDVQYQGIAKDGG